MAKFNWMEINREDVIKAIDTFLKENPEYPEPRSTFLVYENKKLPAKHIRGMAYKEHYGVEIRKNDFGGGMETVRFFERLGFEMEYSGTTARKENVKKIDKERKSQELKSPEKNDRLIESSIDKTEIISNDRIIIPSKQVIEQKNALQLLLNRMFDGDIVCEKTYPWLKTPNKIEGTYKRIYDALSAYRGDTSFAKKNVTLRCDFVCEGQKLIIEYDERQHFSEARKISLEAYENVELEYDRMLWIKACREVKAKDNSPKNRDEIRAYYDSTRDIACYEQGYKLVRIMHGQIDFTAEDAYSKLQEMLRDVLDKKDISKCDDEKKVNDLSKGKKAPFIKVAMYLQTDELKNKRSFEKIFPIMKESDADIIVFPEHGYIPGIRTITNTDILIEEDREKIYDACLELSEQLGKAVIVSSHDKYDTIYSVFANAKPLEGETEISIYIKHTMCGSSCLDFSGYQYIVGEIFNPILYKGYLIGMTICYDSNHAMFSRMYGMYGIDLIINSTGGNVVYDKWFKYNKVRAIENNCYSLVTMGGDGHVEDGPYYVYGFNKNGGQLNPVNLCGDSSKHNVPGGLYVYTVSGDAGEAEIDNSNQSETVNKKWDLKYMIGKSNDIINSSEKVANNIYCKSVGNANVMFIIVDGEDILRPEIIQKLLYSKEIKKYKNRKYVIINRFDEIDEKFFKEKLSIVLKVRAMENFCAVVLESKNINKCYQSGKNRTAQVVRATDGYWGIDLGRTSGPEAIWKNKPGMRASWRDNYEWLVENAEKIYDQEIL